ncbi:hypothetical protein LCGC14_2030930 [marine sediment metagenome]|uniref:Uncharacterized protein n=1 Tax=marine sediment metagenome TaxID=412755 RepID=A0A0F9FHB2_9ZZZZ
MTKTCKNCGHDEWEHTYKAKWSRCMYGNGKLCKCKKFEAEKKKPFDDAVKIILGEEQKGCGKGYRYFNGANWQKNYCGIDGLCPKCKPQNHSQKHLGYYNHDSVIYTTEKTGTFNLSDKIYDDFMTHPDAEQTYSIDAKDVKEFIKRLKAKQFTMSDENYGESQVIALEDLDKLAGDLR